MNNVEGDFYLFFYVNLSKKIKYFIVILYM
jgi:hypothetical protein